MEACGDSGDANYERGLVPRREEGAPREEGRANVPLGPSWCCLPGVAVAVGAKEFTGAVIWNVGPVAIGVVSPVFPPSALLSQEARGVAAPWWGSPPTKSAKVLPGVSVSREIDESESQTAGERGRPRCI